jgi:hypothetical protein
VSTSHTFEGCRVEPGDQAQATIETVLAGEAQIVHSARGGRRRSSFGRPVAAAFIDLAPMLLDDLRRLACRKQAG